MKTNKPCLFTLLALGGLMVLGPIARAEDTPPPAAGAGDKAPAERPNAREQMEKVFTAIKATDEQKEKLKPIFKERNEKFKALQDDTSLSREDRMAKRKEINKDITGKVKEVLSPDQFAEYQKFQKAQAANRRGPNGGPPPADATPKN